MDHLHGNSQPANRYEFAEFLLLLRALRVALGLRVLLLALCGVVLTMAARYAVDQWLFEPTDVGRIEGQVAAADGESPMPDTDAFDFSASGVLVYLKSAVSLVPSSFIELLKPFGRLCDTNTAWTGRGHALAYVGIDLILWVILGGAIARIAALELTRRESLSVQAAVASSIRYAPALMFAPLLAGGAILLLVLPMALFGLAMRIDAIAWAGGITWFIGLLLGFAVAIVLFGLIAGWPLMWATIAVERSDAFDAVSRSYAYVYQRPLQLVLLALSACLSGALGAVVVSALATATVEFTDWAVTVGSGHQRMQQLQGTTTAGDEAQSDGYSWMNTARQGRQLWVATAQMFIKAFPFGFLFSFSVAIYLLLRRSVDATHTDEVALDDDEPIASLPPLAPHPSGVPDVPSIDATSSSPS